MFLAKMKMCFEEHSIFDFSPKLKPLYKVERKE